MSTKKLLIGVTGSVAAIKLAELTEELCKLPDVEVQIVTTECSLHFFDATQLPVKVYRDEDEWKWSQRGDPVLHIELRKWADLMVLAPLDANTLAKIANGLCDNLLTCIIRAWDKQCPLLFAPAMNSLMWEHPLTKEHVNKLESLGYIHIPPVEKKLICGDKGIGAMASVSTILSTVHTFLTSSSDIMNVEIS